MTIALAPTWGMTSTPYQGLDPLPQSPPAWEGLFVASERWWDLSRQLEKLAVEEALRYSPTP